MEVRKETAEHKLPFLLSKFEGCVSPDGYVLGAKVNNTLVLILLNLQIIRNKLHLSSSA